MERASPVRMRKCLEIVESLKQAGILFVPIPVIDDSDFYELMWNLDEKLKRLGEIADKTKQ